MKQILIAGCGDLGTRLGERLSAEGNTVWGLRRRPDCLPACIRPITADLTATDLQRYLPRALTHVIYTAAADERSDRAYADAYVRGLGNMLRSLQTQGQSLHRVLFTSSTAVYGQSDGQWVDENSATQPTTFAGRRLLEAERCLRQGPYPATVVRLAGIYGPNRTRLLDRVRSGEARQPAGARFTNRIHCDDCVGALCHLIALERPDPIYLGVDHDPADLRQVLQWLADQLGVCLRPEDPTGHGESIPHKRCRNRRLVRAGYDFQYATYRDGYAAILGTPRNP